ncbi:hypothetical protein CASFOL_030782 [Castilleja foliolosa]|uniref:Uncharacterized protein n=1 Tax=Castilleja foliolosa TaxID=1961234 RepID=A0ABD3C6B0_9LAMI
MNTSIPNPNPLNPHLSDYFGKECPLWEKSSDFPSRFMDLRPQ